MANCYKATFDARSPSVKAEPVKTEQLFSGNSLRHAAVKAEEWAKDHGAGELIRMDKSDQVVI